MWTSRTVLHADGGCTTSECVYEDPPGPTYVYTAETCHATADAGAIMVTRAVRSCIAMVLWCPRSGFFSLSHLGGGSAYANDLALGFARLMELVDTTWRRQVLPAIARLAAQRRRRAGLAPRTQLRHRAQLVRAAV